MNATRKTKRCKNIYGQTITVFENDFIGKRIEKKGLYETALLAYVEKILNAMDAPIVWDVGAHIGNHTLSFSRKAAHVYAFEPVPEIFSLLSKNVRRTTSPM